MSIVHSFNEALSVKRKVLIVASILIIPLTLLEIWSLNRLSTLGDEIIKLQKAKESLALENQILENDISKTSSLKTIEAYSIIFGFEKPSKIEYLKINDLALNSDNLN